jgi:hypothetical protein
VEILGNSPVYWTDKIQLCLEGVIMEDYDSQYEGYKNTLLHERWLRNKLTDLYRGSLNVEKDYIDENGALWKVGLLGAACGFLIAFTPVENGNWVLGISLFLGIVGSIIWARHIGEKFKKKSGERKFYAFEYDKYFEDRINEDRRREMSEFDQDLSKIADYMRWCVNDKASGDPTEVMEQFRHSLRRVEELEKRYKDILEFDRFPGSLKNDYYFNAEIQKDIDKYV